MFTCSFVRSFVRSSVRSFVRSREMGGDGSSSTAVGEERAKLQRGRIEAFLRDARGLRYAPSSRVVPDRVELLEPEEEGPEQEKSSHGWAAEAPPSASGARGAARVSERPASAWRVLDPWKGVRLGPAWAVRWLRLTFAATDGGREDCGGRPGALALVGAPSSAA